MFPVASSPDSEGFAGQPLRPLPYNPLDKTELARSVEAALLATRPQRLTGLPEFYGVGIYVLYYVGPHRLYAPIAGTTTPIYVGKAVSRGARKALTDDTVVRRELWERVNEHRDSAASAENLEAADFRVRYLVADDVFVPLAERLMIRTLAPVWNVVVDGFGNHDPGGGRYNQRLSPWDAIHPGRPWARRLTQPCKSSREEIETSVAAHYVAHPPVHVEAKLPPATVDAPAEEFYNEPED